jgi:glycosyltransferase involved in cell wall biosynthesis
LARVLVCSFSVVPGPDRHGVQLLHVLRALASRFALDVLTLRVGDLAYVERFQKTRMLRVPVPDASLGEQVEAFRRALKRQLEGAEYDVVHFRDAWSGLAVLERKPAFGYKTVFDVGRSTMGEPRPADIRLAAELARDEDLCCARADLVITPTDLGRRFLAAKGRPDRFVVVPPGVDVDRFDAEVSDLASGAVPQVLYAGTLSAGQGVRVLLRAFRDVRAQVPAKLVLAGPIQHGFGDPLYTAIEQLGLTGHVELLGAIENEDMPRVIARAAVCVAPSAPDTVDRPTACFPTKLLEYLACRRAVIAPRRSSLSEVVQDNVEGLLFKPGDPRDLADKMVRLLRDPLLRERLGETGQRRVRERFAASASRRRLLEAYTKILPISTWNPLGQAMAPIPIPQTGSNFVFDADPSDTNPALATDDSFGGATMITAAPPGTLLEDTGTSTRSLASPETTDPWVVVALDPRKPKESTDGGDGTPSDGVKTPTPQLGVGFVAGELDTRAATATPAGGTAPPKVAVAADEPEDLAFTAASELLGAKKP